MVGRDTSELRLGTASWTAPSWSGVFYPPGIPAAEYLAYYAREFDTVEVDSTWYRAPAPRMVDGWAARTPEGFLFSVKAPQTITHEACLVGCQAEVDAFLSTMERLGSKMGPVLFQFPYFKKSVFSGPGPFLERLGPFLDALPRDRQFAVEVRNKAWLAPPLLDLLRARNAALALIDHPWMPTAAGYARIPGIITADFLYVRWLGDRSAIEEKTTSWGELVVDRSRETESWVRLLRDFNRLVGRTYAYYNNHYAGCAFASCRLFQNLWNQTLLPEDPARPG